VLLASPDSLVSLELPESLAFWESLDLRADRSLPAFLAELGAASQQGAAYSKQLLASAPAWAGELASVLRVV